MIMYFIISIIVYQQIFYESRVRKDSTNIVVNTKNCYKSQGLEIQSYRKELCTYPIQWKTDLD
jgi:hypothetical protein